MEGRRKKSVKGGPSGVGGGGGKGYLALRAKYVFFYEPSLSQHTKNKIYGYNNNYEIKKNLYINTKDKKDKNIKQKTPK